MMYDHKIKFNGTYYEAGVEIPDAQPRLMDEQAGLSDSKIQFENAPHEYTREELEEISVKKIRQLAEDMGFEITKTIKDDVINEFLLKQ